MKYGQAVAICCHFQKSPALKWQRLRPDRIRPHKSVCGSSNGDGTVICGPLSRLPVKDTRAGPPGHLKKYEAGRQRREVELRPDSMHRIDCAEDGVKDSIIENSLFDENLAI